MRIYPTNKLVYNHIDQMWSFDLADMIDYKISNIKGFRFKFKIVDIFSNYTWCIPLRNNYWRNKNKRIFKFLNNIKTKTS